MARTLAENINQTVTDFDSIQTAIIQKGVEVPSNIPTSQYATKIGEILSGANFPDSWIDERTIKAKENITKDDAIAFYNALNMESGDYPSISPDQVTNQSYDDCSFSPDGTLFIIINTFTSKMIVYKIIDGIFNKVKEVIVGQSIGKYVRSCTFSPDGSYIAIGCDSGVEIHKLNGTSFTHIANLLGAMPNSNKAVAISPDGTYVAFGNANAPFISIRKRNGDAFTKLPNPSNLPPNRVESLAFSPDGTYLAVTPYSNVGVEVYKRNGDIFTKLPTLNGNSLACNCCSFSLDGIFLAIGSSRLENLMIYKRDGDTFTKLNIPKSPIEIDTNNCSFSPDGKYLMITVNISPFLSIYKRNGDTFTKLSNITSIPTSYINKCIFNYNGNYIGIAFPAAPFLTIYQINAEEVVAKLTSMSFGSSLYFGLGIALDDCLKDQPCSVNLFPPINNARKK